MLANMVDHVCDPTYLEGRDRKIAIQGQLGEKS
jgi:hypothetical protein